MLLNLGMLALLLDLAHPFYVWAVYLTFEVASPMSWGSWVLLVVYAILLVSALIRLHEAWPWLGRTFPVVQRWSDAITGHPSRVALLGWINIVFGVAVGIYTGILLNTMVARPLWNTAVLPVLFLVSGLSAGAAAMHLATRFFGHRPAPQGMVAGFVAALAQPLGSAPPERSTVDALIRADVVLLAVEFVLLLLLVLGLLTSTASHVQAVQLVLGGPYTLAFWGAIVVAGILVPVVLQSLELSHRIPHTVVPALLVLAGGYVLRWVMVNAGQVAEVVQASVR
jgi:formate-dependent nitrite reductase membrane component NrfD